jgi:hypothetical protein
LIPAVEVSVMWILPQVDFGRKSEHPSQNTWLDLEIHLAKQLHKGISPVTSSETISSRQGFDHD